MLQNFCGIYLLGKSTVLSPAFIKRVSVVPIHCLFIFRLLLRLIISQTMGGVWAGDNQQDSFEFALYVLLFS